MLRSQPYLTASQQAATVTSMPVHTPLALEGTEMANDQPYGQLSKAQSGKMGPAPRRFEHAHLCRALKSVICFPHSVAVAESANMMAIPEIR